MKMWEYKNYIKNKFHYLNDKKIPVIIQHLRERKTF